MLLIAFLVFTAGRDKKTITVPTSDELIGWALLALIVSIGIDIEATSEVFSALTVLILLAVLLEYGPNVFAKIPSSSTSTNPLPTPPNTHIGGK